MHESSAMHRGAVVTAAEASCGGIPRKFKDAARVLQMHILAMQTRDFSYNYISTFASFG
jgi:hypothetical protein